MSAWEDISDSYVAAASRVLPLQRIAVFAIAFCVSLIAQNSTHKSLLESFSAIPISEFINIDSGLISKATGLNFIVAIFAVVFCKISSKWVIETLYLLINRSMKIDEIVNQVDLKWIHKLSFEERKQAAELYGTGLVDVRSRLKSLSSLNEFTIGVALIFLTGSYFGNIIDLTIGMISIIISFHTHRSSLFLFIKKYYSNALTRAAFLGCPLPEIGQQD